MTMRQSEQLFHDLKARNPFNVKVGEIWQSNREPDVAVPRKHYRELQQYGLRFKVIKIWQYHATVENCLGMRNQREIRLDRFNSSKKGYTRIGR